MFRILFLFWLSFHPVHVSLTSLDYIPGTGNFKGFVRVYLDDFLLDCGCAIQQEMLISGDKASTDVLEKYLNGKIIISVNGSTISGDIIDVEINNNEVDINLQYYNSRKPETITVKNLVLTEIYKDQSNMVIVKVNDFEEGVKLTPEVTERTFKVN